MPRPSLHTVDDILDAARDLVLTGGIRAATIDRVVAASGAPKGSIYHRFPTINDLLAAVWLRSARESQQHYRDALGHEDALEACVAAALSLHDFAVAHPEDARLLAAVRREDLLAGAGGAASVEALIAANDELASTFAALARRLYGRATRSAVDAVITATVDLPLGALRRHLEAAEPPPPGLRRQLEAAVRAALAAR